MPSATSAPRLRWGGARPDRRHPFEKVAELAPDLIVGLYSGLTDEQYRTLSQIAPTVAQPPGQENYSVSWQETTLTLGTILGKPAEAQKLVDDTEARFAQERAAHPQFAGKSAVAATFYEGYYVYGPDDPRGRLLDTDAFVWVAPDTLRQQLTGDPVYSRLDVATRDRAVFLDENTPFGKSFSFITPLSIPYILDGLVPQLAAAVDGGPATGT